MPEKAPPRRLPAHARAAPGPGGLPGGPGGERLLGGPPVWADGLRRPPGSAHVFRVACIRPVEAGEHPVHGRASAPVAGHAGDGQRRASRLRGEQLWHDGSTDTDHAGRVASCPPLRAVARGRGTDEHLLGIVTRGRGGVGGVLRRPQAGVHQRGGTRSRRTRPRRRSCGTTPSGRHAPGRAPPPPRRGGR